MVSNLVRFSSRKAGFSSILSRSFSAAHFHSSESLSKKICILGGGQMCEAILGALTTKGIQRPKDITVVDIHEKRLLYLEKKYGVVVTTDTNEGAADAELTLLCVKPQNVRSLAASLKNPTDGILISIVAGFTIADLKQLYRTDKVIRSMPNTPAMVMEGITVWCPTPESPPELVDKARTLLNSMGEQVQVQDEHYVDMATAVSGTGPAVRAFFNYSFFINSLIFNFLSFFFISLSLQVCLSYDGSNDRRRGSFGLSSRYRDQAGLHHDQGKCHLRLEVRGSFCSIKK
jgi:pyrroline-5-carboxylate reductase